jgi:hypothetical protein
MGVEVRCALNSCRQRLQDAAGQQRLLWCPQRGEGLSGALPNDSCKCNSLGGLIVHVFSSCRRGRDRAVVRR